MTFPLPPPPRQPSYPGRFAVFLILLLGLAAFPLFKIVYEAESRAEVKAALAQSANPQTPRGHQADLEAAEAASDAREQSRWVAVVWIGAVVTVALMLASRERRLANEEADRQAALSAEARARKLEAIGRLASGLAHDLNNYLGVITGQAEMVQRDAQPGEPVNRRMEVILSTSWKASDLIRRVLAFGRRQTGRTEVIDLARVLAELPETARPLLDEDVKLELKVAQGLWPIEGDPTQLQQALLHLLANAWEAMPRGGVVRVEAANRALSEGNRVLLTVTDSGVGIPEDIRDQIFDPFFTT
ncbi:MAG TPA: ATP-binding protein, partial [Thermoanaerobaculia bacterium]|nr:ATP-binding protein [Thermoanaerobaculia bacterium]